MKKTFSVVLTEEQGLRLKEYADSYGISQSEVIRLLVVKFLHQDESELCPYFKDYPFECLHSEFINLVYNFGKAK